MAEIQTIDEMRETYREDWVLVADYDGDEFGRLVRGRVVAHSLDRDDIYREMANRPGGWAVEYFGEIPADLYYVL